jgi:hypothetical protein
MQKTLINNNLDYDENDVEEHTWFKGSKKVCFFYREEGMSYVAVKAGRIHKTGFVSDFGEILKVEAWLNAE